MLEAKGKANISLTLLDARKVPIVLKKSENLRGRLFGERQLRRGYHLNAGCALLRASYEEKWVGRLSPQPKFLIVDSRR
jgi:hypothetical protein